MSWWSWMTLRQQCSLNVLFCVELGETICTHGGKVSWESRQCSWTHEESEQFSQWQSSKHWECLSDPPCSTLLMSLQETNPCCNTRSSGHSSGDVIIFSLLSSTVHPECEPRTPTGAFNHYPEVHQKYTSVDRKWWVDGRFPPTYSIQTYKHYLCITDFLLLESLNQE